ncbi:hypothetical protein [Edaphobacter modestus]|uniref:Glycosyl hydrolase family 79 n=1 Tax=Edaphobacter modestus TaxID=388466 RepID=A0A4Q7Z106_9BACT|nr:hypothetical protein [Edaphobacter modestus]RZU43301.1 hypothetical protein BDD14_4958 [Edaphobacter modestus]
MSPLPFARRKFLRQSSLTLALAALRPASLFAQAPTAALKLGSGAPIAKVPADFIGLSYEAMQLEDPTFFSPANTGLIAEFRKISSHGVLRLGGNTSEFGWWKATPASQPPVRTSGKADNGEPPPTTIFAITPEAIHNLNGFLKATGWTCIYGLNLGFAVEAADVAEARFVAQTLGTHLQYFQLGNEVDMFNRHLRDPKTWGVDQYLKEWVPLALAVQKAVPGAKFGMPDVASDVSWLPKIADRWASLPEKPNVITLSHHYYWGGPPSSANANIERLLRPSPAVAQKAALAREAATKMGVPFRMTEGNTVYQGGKPGLSDAFAAALWGADYLFELMSLGYSGVNLHGGSGHAQAVSVGGFLRGEQLMKDPNVPHPKPFYTPIANEGTLAGSGVDGKLNGKYLIEPVGYGMKFASRFAGTTLLPIDFNPGTVNAVAYAARRADNKVIVAVLNKDASQELTLSMAAAQVIEVLSGSALDQPETHITPGGKSIKSTKAAEGQTITIPAHTAVMLQLR